MIDLTNPSKVFDLDELYLTLEELQEELSITEDEFEIYELEDNINCILSLINEHPERGEYHV